MYDVINKLSTGCDSTYEKDGLEFRNTYNFVNDKQPDTWGRDIMVREGKVNLRNFDTSEDPELFKFCEYSSSPTELWEVANTLEKLDKLLLYEVTEEPVSTYQQIINWMYVNDNKFNSKSEWREAFSSFLKSILK